jgi:hypothetical protein
VKLKLDVLVEVAGRDAGLGTRGWMRGLLLVRDWRGRCRSLVRSMHRALISIGCGICGVRWQDVNVDEGSGSNGACYMGVGMRQRGSLR